MCEGFTRKQLPFPPELIDEPLPRWWVARIGTDFEKPGANVYRPDRHRRKARAITAAMAAH